MAQNVLVNGFFRKFATKTSEIAGRPWAFIVAIIVIAIWALSGPVFAYSNTWQLFINTGTTIVTLLMVFLIQNTQNRDSKAIHLKLDELLKGVKGARNSLVNIEEDTDEAIEQLQEQFRKLQKHYSGKKMPAKKHSVLSQIIAQMAKFVEKPLTEDR